MAERDRAELAMSAALPAWLPLWYRERRIRRAMDDWDARNRGVRVSGCITVPPLSGPIIALRRG